MKRKLLIIVSLVIISAKLTRAAELQVITVALVSPSWSTGYPMQSLGAPVSLETRA
jgi:hypothetical protein